MITWSLIRYTCQARPWVSFTAKRVAILCGARQTSDVFYTVISCDIYKENRHAQSFGEAGEIRNTMNDGSSKAYDVRVVSVGSGIVEEEVILLPILVSPTSSASSEFSWYLPLSYSRFPM